MTDKAFEVEEVSYTVTCVVKGEAVVEVVIADHVETGTHWVKLFHGGKLTGLFSAGTVTSVLPTVRTTEVLG